MIQVYVIRATNLSTRSNYSSVSVNVYANGYTKTKIGKTKKSKLQNPIFDIDKKNPFFVPFVIASTLEFEVVVKSNFKHKMVIGSSSIPIFNVGEECTFEAPITSISHINNDAKLTIIIIPNVQPFNIIANFTRSSLTKTWKTPFYVYLSSPNCSSIEIERDIISHSKLSILRFQQLGRYNSLITSDSQAVFSGIRLPLQEQDYHINDSSKHLQMADVFEFNPEILSPFYYTPIVSCSGFKGKLFVNVVTNLSPPSKSLNFDFKIIKQVEIDVDQDGCYSCGLIFWPKLIGRISFIAKQPLFLGDFDFQKNDQILSQISPSLKSNLVNGPFTQDVRRRLYQSEEESYSFALENISDFTGSLFPPIFNCSISNIKAKNKVFMNYYLFDKNYKNIPNQYDNLLSNKSENSISIKLFEIPEDINYVVISAKTNAKTNNQAKLTITDSDNNKEIANSLTFLMSNSYTKILFILYRVTDDHWSSIEGQDWVSIKDEQKIPSKIAKIISAKLNQADKNVKHLKKLISIYNNI